MATVSWIRLIRLPGLIPSHALPDDDSRRPIKVSGHYSVRWPDGHVSEHQPRIVEATARSRNGTEETGTYAFFEVPFHGMTVIYDLHEVELQADQVAKRQPATKKPARASSAKKETI